MTAEIVLMNPLAVAMAADSVVSIGDAKEYQSANKLFMLRNQDPVGIMLYGNASFLDVPWELVIKEYRSARDGEDPLDTIDDYADDFMSFVATNDVLFPASLKAEVAKAELARYLHYLHTEMVIPQIEDAIADKGAIDEAETFAILEQTLDEQTQWLLGRDEIDVHGAEYLLKVQDVLQDVHVEAAQTVLGDGLPATTLAAVRELAYAMFSHRFRTGPSGLVIAGFGVRDIFPAMREIEPQFLIGDAFAFHRGRTADINPHDLSAVVVPCAQRSTVDAFIGGVDPQIQAEVTDALGDVFREWGETVVTAVAAMPNAPLPADVDDLKEACHEQADALRTAFDEAIEKRKQERYSDPILEAVRILPKDELAAMADSLVNLTSLRQRVSMTRETVGGPIDVAVISRGDGFVWIKRKHYFPPQLNPHFFTRYNQVG